MAFAGGIPDVTNAHYDRSWVSDCADCFHFCLKNAVVCSCHLSCLFCDIMLHTLFTPSWVGRVVCECGYEVSSVSKWILGQVFCGRRKVVCVSNWNFRIVGYRNRPAVVESAKVLCHKSVVSPNILHWSVSEVAIVDVHVRACATCSGADRGSVMNNGRWNNTNLLTEINIFKQALNDVSNGMLLDVAFFPFFLFFFSFFFLFFACTCDIFFSRCWWCSLCRGWCGWRPRLSNK